MAEKKTARKKSAGSSKKKTTKKTTKKKATKKTAKKAAKKTAKKAPAARKKPSSTGEPAVVEAVEPEPGGKKGKGRLKVKQVRSRIGTPGPHKATLAALGLRRMHQTVEHDDTPVIRGMVLKIGYLLQVEEA